MSFLDIPTLDSAGRRALLTQLQAWSAVSSTSQLKTLSLGIRYTSTYELAGIPPEAPRRSDVVPCTQRRCDHFPWPATRTSPSWFSVDHNVVHIVKPLVIGCDQYSQVYAASFDPVETRNPEHDFIVKIYQASMCPAVKKFEERHFDQGDIWQQEFLACRTEEWAYRQATPFQGVVIPHIYGFFHVELPHGEPSIALIIEKIDNIPDSIVSSSAMSVFSRPEDALNALGMALLMTAHALHTCNVGSLDIASRNVLWPRESFGDPDKRPFPIFIDFGKATTLYPGLRSQSVLCTVQMLIQYGFERGLVRSWLRSEITEPGSRILKLFDIPDKRAESYEAFLELGDDD